MEPRIVCIDPLAPGDCAWCGADIGEEMLAGTTDRPYPNRRGEVFCRRSHREASNRALREFLRERERHMLAIGGTDANLTRRHVQAMREAWEASDTARLLRGEGE